MAGADVAYKEGDAAQWGRIKGGIPKEAKAYLGAIVAIQQLGRTELAELALGEAIKLFPNSIEISAVFATNAAAAGNWESALVRWQAVKAKYPGHPNSSVGIVVALRALGRLDDCERFVDEAMGLFAPVLADGVSDPWVRALAVHHAEIATQRGKWVVALQRWETLSNLFPDDVALKSRHRACVALARHAKPEAPPTVTISESQSESTASDRDDGASHAPDAQPDDTNDTPPLLRFEGLGDSCEFGLVQRKYGHEPLGLLRWVAISVPRLVAALESNFGGVGDPEYTELIANDAGEFVTKDTRFGMTMHTFINVSGQDRNQLHAQLCQRLRYLRSKLVEDLKEGLKIFLYRSSVVTSEDEVRAIHAALRLYHNRNRLLAIRLPDTDHPNGSLEKIAPGLAVGYVRPGRLPAPSLAWDIAFDTWEHVCEEAITELAKPTAYAAVAEL